MKRVHKFLRLPSADRRLLVETVLILAAIRLALRILPFRWLCRLLPCRSRALKPPSTDRLIASVKSASYYNPGATCLARAVTLHILMTRAGYESCVRIGFAPDGGTLSGHAWLEVGTRIAFGGPDVARYSPLLSIEGACK
jgi:hypothetical protein